MATRFVVSQFSIPIKTIQRIWKQANDCGTSIDVHKKVKLW